MRGGENVDMAGHPIAYRHYRWDHDEPDLHKYFDECFAFIDAARSRNENVLVHCQLGVSRSASLVIAYVMRTLGMGFSAAYEYVQSRAPCISPNLSLIAQLCEYGKTLDSKSDAKTPVTATNQPELVVRTSDMVVSPGLPGLTHSASSSEYSSPVEEKMATATHSGLSVLDGMPPLPLPLLVRKPTVPSHDTRVEPTIIKFPFH
ncbi:tyrosine/serine/threonine protein phosphatase [Linderina pennispora]|nr:tyrosine/serine/threonine protein phosphatase [Linderina pennispora]